MSWPAASSNWRAATSTDCTFWPSRFGKRPETFANKYGPFLLTPEIMPGADVDEGDLPGTVAVASEWLRERHPEIEWDGPRERTPEEVERGKQMAARLKAARVGGQEIDSEVELPSENRAVLPGRPR